MSNLIVNCYLSKSHLLFIQHSRLISPLIYKKNRLTSLNIQNRPASDFRHVYENFFRKVTESEAVNLAVDNLVNIHNATGLSWGSTIVVVSIGLRCMLTLPASIHQSIVLAKLELCKLEYAKIIEDLKKETAFAIKKFNWTEKQTRIAYTLSAKKQWRLLIERYNCHPFKATLVFWIQLPLWIILSFSIRAMSNGIGQDLQKFSALQIELTHEQWLWLTSLATPDSTWILPLLVVLTNLVIIEIHSCQNINRTKLQKVLTHALRFLTFASFPIAVNVPSCLSLYWVTSSGLALLQTLSLMSPKVRRVLKIPKTPSQVERPYYTVWCNFLNKFKFSK